ncbi:MAG: hypothetical protein FJW37_01420, partial [Acidobacteria bacterium]|nr:hypothetical protein [Acidobacteriota bacterium]
MQRMPRNIRRTGIATLLAALAAGVSLDANWPQWRGPHFNGSSSSARGLAVTWSETKNVLWRAALPSWSAATPIIWENTVFVTSAEEGFTPLDRGARRASAGTPPGKIFLLAVNREDGSVRWRREIGDGNQLYRKQNSASPSPITDGKHVWTMTGNGRLSCLTMEGKEVWKRDIQAEYGRFGINHGYASTPLLDGDRLYVQVLHGMTTDDPSYVFALNKSTGKTLWKVERPTDAV